MKALLFLASTLLILGLIFILQVDEKHLRKHMMQEISVLEQEVQILQRLAQIPRIRKRFIDHQNFLKISHDTNQFGGLLHPIARKYMVKIDSIIKRDRVIQLAFWAPLDTDVYAFCQALPKNFVVQSIGLFRNNQEATPDKRVQGRMNLKVMF